VESVAAADSPLPQPTERSPWLARTNDFLIVYHRPQGKVFLKRQLFAADDAAAVVAVLGDL
jgi:hypothetical protein